MYFGLTIHFDIFVGVMQFNILYSIFPVYSRCSSHPLLCDESSEGDGGLVGGEGTGTLSLHTSVKAEGDKADLLR